MTGVQTCALRILTDNEPPQLKIQVPGITSAGTVPGGEVKVKVQASESLVSSPELRYSLGDSDNWTLVAAPTIESGWYVFNLGKLRETLVNICVDATDMNNNYIRRVTWRAFYVGGVQVSIKAPSGVIPGSNFTAVIGINQVQNLVAATYDVSFNSTVLTLTNVTSGNISGTTVPVGAWSERSPGVFGISQTVGLPGASGSGYLAVLHFRVLGSENQSSNITFSNATLGTSTPQGPQPIAASWNGALVTVVTVRPGDAYPDGKVDALDLVEVARIIVGLTGPKPGADANLDGKINSLDITKIERIFVGLDP